MTEKTAAMFKSEGEAAFYTYLSIKIVYTQLAYFYDLYYSWGLLRSREKGKWGLRSKLFYPQKFYYFAIVVNLLLRHTWILSMLNSLYVKDAFFDNSIIEFVITSLKLTRRLVWGILRVENENIYNFESYRNILEIPRMQDEEEIIEQQRYEKDLMSKRKRAK